MKSGMICCDWIYNVAFVLKKIGNAILPIKHQDKFLECWRNFVISKMTSKLPHFDYISKDKRQLRQSEWRIFFFRLQIKLDTFQIKNSISKWNHFFHSKKMWNCNRVKIQNLNPWPKVYCNFRALIGWIENYFSPT